MPGFLGGSSGSSGTGGEITFPKEFIDPVTKLRISAPENLIDTDFEYGLQPTKWETVELINNTPSFFSKSGDTTIPNIVSISTNNGTREITVTTATEHGLAVGIPINVTGTKSVTADGSYVINSIPNTFTFTYLCKDEQVGNNSIEDLYSSIITGEFFQGSQIRIADSEGITTDAESISTLTVKTDSTHGFGINTPFYFLNLNSTISQEFEASNTAAKSFDSSNSATAQTFDGSNTLSTFNIDWSNSATVGGTTSTISTVNTTNDTITVSHGAENFGNQPLGTPLYYNLTTPASSGYFLENPRGVVFLKTTNALNSPVGSSTFQVSAVPDGDVIDIVSSMSGTFQLANQARTFAGNNLNPTTQTAVTVIRDAELPFDGGNQGFVGAQTNGLCTVEGYSGTILVSTTAGAGLDYYVGAMVRYSTTGSAASGLTNNRTYFIASFATTATPNQFRITIREFPDTAALAPTGGSGDQTFQKIGISTDKDIIHIKDANFAVKDMIEYSTFPVGGRFTPATLGETKLFYFVQKAYDAHNYELSESVFAPTAATGGVIGTYTSGGVTYRTHTFTTVGTTNFVVSAAGTNPAARYLIVAGGGAGGNGTGQGYEAGGGGGGGVLRGSVNLTATTYPVVVGAGGSNSNGGNSSAFSLTAIGGGQGGSSPNGGASGGSGGGGSHSNNPGGAGTAGQGFAGAQPGQGSSGGGGGGAGEAGNTDGLGHGGDGVGSNISGNTVFYGGGGAAFHAPGQGNNIGSPVGEPGVGGGGQSNHDIDTSAALFAANKNAEASTGGGGGAGYASTGGANGGLGGSGIVIISYPITAPPAIIAPVCSGGQSTNDVNIDGIIYRVHQYTTVGTHTFTVTSPGNQVFEYLVIAGGGGGGTQHGSGGGAGGYRCSVPGEFSGRLSAAETPLSLVAGSYTVVVGAGGTGAPGNAAQGVRGGIGGNSQFHTITSIGGGGGGSWATDNGSERAQGGSGGGAWVSAGSSGGNAGAGIAGQGFGGGAGTDTSQPHVGSGGGGAGGPGFQGKTGGRRAAGRGGIGIPSNITGTPTFRASGGGGGCYWSAGQTQPNRAERREGGGGLGGFAYQSDSQPGSEGGAGTPNTGGGGGSAGQYERNGGAGGSGIVIIRYPIAVA